MPEPEYGSMEGSRSTGRNMVLRTRMLVGAVVMGAAVLVVGGMVDVMYRQNAQRTVLYDIPNFVYQRTQVHFPQAEENWLNMAAHGEIGDDVKPEHVLHNLNHVIADARSHALQENYEARVKAKVDAMTENYSTYDVHKGKVVNNFYGGKQTGGTVTLKPMGVTNTDLPQLAQPQIEGGMMLKQHDKKVAVQMKQKELRNDHLAVLPAPHAPMLSFAVDVPQGLTAGQQFIAQVPAHGQMLVTVPQGGHGGETVQIQVPAGQQLQQPRAPAAHKPAVHKPAVHKPVLRQPQRAVRASAATGAVSEHPLAARMVMDALFDHYRSVPHGVFGLEH